MTNGSGGPVCDNCGAPAVAGLAACSYCKTAYAWAGASGGVACPRCGDVNVPQNTACASCHEPMVRACLFCGAPSPLASSACVRCGEAFAGAADRKKARDEQMKQQQVFKLAEEGIEVVEKAVANPSVRSGLLGVLEEIVETATKGG